MTSTSATSLAMRIREERLRLGWTQKDLGARAAVGATSCRRFERTGQITLQRLLRICGALGFALTLGERTTDAPMPDARVARIRQRGLRRRQPQPVPEPAAPDGAELLTNSEAASEPPKQAVSRPASASDVAEIGKRFRQEIRLLANGIVFNRLTNHTSAAVVQTSMRALRVADASKPAFVAAVEGELTRLTTANCTEIGIDPRHFERWSKTWDRSLGIVRALE